MRPVENGRTNPRLRGSYPVLSALAGPVQEQDHGKHASAVVALWHVERVLSLTLVGLLTGAIPTMVLVGPAIAAHWWWLHRRHPKERTAGEFESARNPDLPGEPRYERPDADLAAALALLADPPPRAAYHAVYDGAVIASGDDAAAVLDAAGRREPNAVPVLVFTRG